MAEPPPSAVAAGAMPGVRREEAGDWVDRFMKQIMARDYDSAREILRTAVARGVSQRLAEQYGKVLENFLRARDELENPVVLARFGSCILRQIDTQTGRGLAVPGFVPGGSVLWKQRPLMYIQSPCSRKCVQVCCACLAPVGSLASQLLHQGLEAPAGTEAVLLGDRVPCEEPCSEVFCSQGCRDWSLAESSHALLCAGRLSPSRLEALRALEQFAEERDQEHLLLLAHGVARMAMCLQQGQPLQEVLQRYARQFASKPWDALAEDGNGAGKEDTPESRRQLLTETLGYLRRLFAEEESAAPLLDEELLSGLLGTFELVNMCISLPHPLNERREDLGRLLDAKALARVAEVQHAADDDSSSEGSAAGEAAEESAEVREPTESAEVETEAAALDSTQKGTLFANVLGTSLCEALSFTNHSCLPNVRMDFATSRQEEAEGPGLWVYCAARRPLIPGDEVLMAYVPSVVGKPLEVRQRRMKRFGFPCRCRSCLTDELLLKEGDIL